MFNTWPENRPLPGKGDLIFHKCFSEGPTNQIACAYAAEAGIPVLNDTVPKSHWAYQAAVDPGYLPLSCELIDEGRSATYKGEWIYAEVVVCGGCRVSLDEKALEKDAEIDAKDKALLKKSFKPILIERFAFVDDELIDSGALIVPGKSDPYDLAALCSSYIDEWDNFQEGHYDADNRNLTSFVDALRADSLAAYLASQISRVKFDADLLENAGKFVITWNPKRLCFEVEETPMAA